MVASHYNFFNQSLKLVSPLLAVVYDFMER